MRNGKSVLIFVTMFLFMAGANAALAQKVLRTNLPADPSQTDPITVSELYAGDVLDNIYEGFTEIDKVGKVVPALATSWEWSDGGKTLKLNLRKGVKFHGGNPFTARDVKWTFEQLLIPENKGGLAAPYLKEVTGAKAVTEGKTKELAGVKVVDDNTVVVSFEKSTVSFPIYPFRFIDSKLIQTKGMEAFKDTSAGTGPFKFVHWKRGQEVRMDANKNYWGQIPMIDAVVFKIVPELDTALNMFETKELDLVFIDRGANRRVLRGPEFKDKLLTAPAAQVQYLAMNQNLYPPFRDIKVREALCNCIDRDAMVAGLFDGAAFPLYGFVVPNFPGNNPNIAPIKPNLAKAKKLLADAGFPGGKGLPPITITGTAVNKEEMAYFADLFKKELGMNVEITTMERATFIKAMNAGEVPMIHWGWSADYADAATFLDDMWHGKSPYNRAKWVNAEYDALIEKARVTADAAERFKIYNQAEQVLLKDFGACPTVMRKMVAVVSPKVKGVILTPFRLQNFNTVTIEN
jgi:oligopeptide transport system substrate-binding protein